MIFLLDAVFDQLHEVVYYFASVQNLYWSDGLEDEKPPHIGDDVAASQACRTDLL